MDSGILNTSDAYCTSGNSPTGPAESAEIPAMLPPSRSDLLKQNSQGISLSPATPIRRRGKSMSRRVGQNGNVFVKPNCKLGRCDHRKGLCPKYGRYWMDQPG